MIRVGNTRVFHLVGNCNAIQVLEEAFAYDRLVVVRLVVLESFRQTHLLADLVILQDLWRGLVALLPVKNNRATKNKQTGNDLNCAARIVWFSW